MTNAERQSITQKAYELLLMMRPDTFPPDPCALNLPDVFIISYGDYGRSMGISPEKLSLSMRYPDAYCTKEVRPGVCLVLYNEACILPRQRYSIWHEIGHITLGHTRCSVLQEREADFFAAQIMAPDAVIRLLQKGRKSINAQLLCEVFGLSHAAAEAKLRALYDCPQTVPAALENAVKSLFLPYIREQFPPLMLRKLRETLAFNEAVYGSPPSCEKNEYPRTGNGLLLFSAPGEAEQYLSRH